MHFSLHKKHLLEIFSIPHFSAEVSALEGYSRLILFGEVEGFYAIIRSITQEFTHHMDRFLLTHLDPVKSVRKRICLRNGIV